MSRRRVAGSESIYSVYRHTMHGACWITTWRVCVSCDTTVTRVPVNAACTHVKEAGSNGCYFVNFFAEKERERQRGERSAAMMKNRERRRMGKESSNKMEKVRKRSIVYWRRIHNLATCT